MVYLKVVLQKKVVVVTACLGEQIWKQNFVKKNYSHIDFYKKKL